MSKRTKKADYEVGYGKPPVATRFKPGQSGNPKGARRKIRPTNIHEAVDVALLKRQTVTIDGKRKRLTRAEIIAERMTLAAVQGDPGSQRELLKMHQFMAKLDRQFPSKKVEQQPVIVTLKLGDEDTERMVQERMVEERVKEFKSKGGA